MKLSRPLIEGWTTSLPQQVSVAGLYARNPTAHKWKAPFRSLVVREALIWRMHDLGQQILLLSDAKHYLGARILLRSAVETFALLTFLSYKVEQVIAGNLSYFEYDEFTARALSGTRNDPTTPEAVSIMTALEKTGKKYPKITEIHELLSESAHPNCDGVLFGYSSSNPKLYETNFANHWAERFGAIQDPATAIVFSYFKTEYNDVWPVTLEKFENWLMQNDARLEKEKPLNPD